jgi:hypothetical protein
VAAADIRPEKGRVSACFFINEGKGKGGEREEEERRRKEKRRWTGVSVCCDE